MTPFTPLTLDQFLAKWNANYCNVIPGYPGQCTNVAEAYNQEVVDGVPLEFHGNAVDFWNNFNHTKYYQIPNEPTNFPSAGDIVVWSVALDPYGHVAIALPGATEEGFESFDQNWPIGSVCHNQNHGYVNAQGKVDVLGWLRPKNPIQVN